MYCDNAALSILVDNATSYSERKEIFSLTESETLKINNEMVAKLFNSALNKKHVDFDNIPATKGNVTAYVGYQSMVESLALMKDIVDKSGAPKIEEIDVIERALSNIVANRDLFEKGFKLNKDFIILQYNTLVSACVAATSTLIASYIDYVKTVNKIEFKITNTKFGIGNTCVGVLRDFNSTVKSGEFAKIMSTIIKTGVVTEAVGTVIAISAAIIGGVILLIKGIRYIVFYFYNSKQKLSDYLKLQSTFLEMNKKNLEVSGYGLSADKRNEVLKKQEDLKQKLIKYSDRLKVDSKMAEVKADADIKKENSTWKFNDVKADALGSDNSGFKLL